MRKPKKYKKKQVEQSPVPQPAAQPPTPDDSAWNFGGLPARDLKKNLGCG